MLYQIFLIATSLIINTNAQACADSEPYEATTTNGPITVTATLCITDSNVYIDITYTQYDSNWFAICFPNNPTANGMIGTAMAYSIGKGSSASEPEAVYAYDITSMAQNGAGVSNPDNTIWTEVAKTIDINNNNIQVIVKTPIGNVPFTATTTSIPFSYAIGKPNELYLDYHASRVSARTGLALAFPTPEPTQTPTATTINPTTTPSQSPTVTTINPTKVPTVSPNNDPTSSPTNNPSITPTNLPTITPTESPIQLEYETCAEAEIVTDVTLTIGRKISDNTMSITITGPDDKWFAFGFGQDVMSDSYAVTAGKLATSDSSVEVREFTLPTSSEANSNGLGTVLSLSETTIETNVVDGGVRTIEISRPFMVENAFNFNDFLTCETDEIDIISAIGSALNLEYHSTREKGTLTRLSGCTCDTTGDDDDEPGDNTGYSNKPFNPMYIIVALCIGLYFVV